MRRLMILTLIFVAATAGAQVTGTVAVGGQGDDTSGGVSRFRELTHGEQGGLFLENLELFGQGPAMRVDVQSHFSTGGSGFLNLTMNDGGAWRGGARVTRSRAWSSLSFADDVLPSGASVATLYPYTTELDRRFATTEPSVDHTRAELFVTRAFGTASALTVRGGLRQRDGIRIPNIGAFAFGDLGTAAFFAPGIEEVDSRSSWGGVDLRTVIGRMALRLDAGAMQRENETGYSFPAYGADALIDLNQWNERTDANTTWIRAGGTYSRNSVSVEGGVSRFATNADVAGRDFRTDRDGLRLDRGDVDATVTSGGIGTTIRLGGAASLSFAADMQSRETEGDGALFLRNTSAGDASTALSSDRVGATADLRVRFSPATRLHLRTRLSMTESDVRENLATRIQDLTRETDRGEVRADLATRFTKQVRGRAFARVGREERTVDLRQLDNGFTVGDSDRSDVGGGFELAIGSGRQSTLLTVSAGRMDFETSEPFFDPVFDPSTVFAVAEGDVTTTRATATTVWSFSAASVWGEVGWLSSDYRFGDVPTYPGFRKLDESVDGAVVAIGTEVHPRDSLRIGGNVEWVRDRGDLDRTLLRGSLELAQTLRNRVELFGRWTTSDLDNPAAAADEFNVDLFAIGFRTKF